MYLFVVVVGKGASVVVLEGCAEVVLTVLVTVVLAVVVVGAFVVVVTGAAVLLAGTSSSIGTGFLIAGAASLLKIGSRTGFVMIGVSLAVSWGKTLVVAGRSSKKRRHRAHVQPFHCLILGI